MTRFVSMNFFARAIRRAVIAIARCSPSGKFTCATWMIRENARASFVQFLKLYPRSPLAPEARIELSNLRHAPRAVHANAAVAQSDDACSIPPAQAPRSIRHRTVIDGPIDSKQSHPQPAKSARTVKPSSHSQHTEVAEKDLANTPPSETLHPEPSHLSEADLNAPPPLRRGPFPLVTGIRHWSTPVYTRVAIDLQDEVQYEAVRVPDPDRIFFDLHGTRLSPELIGKSDQVIDDGFLKQIRAAQFSNDVTRIVLDVSDVSDYSAFFLPNPPRLIIDVHGSRSRPKPISTAENTSQKTKRSARPDANAASAAAASTLGLGPEVVPGNKLGEPLPSSRGRQSTQTVDTPNPDALGDVASLSAQPNRVRATRRPTTAPVAQSVAGTSPAPQPDELAAASPAP